MAVEQIIPDCTNYPLDKEFPLACAVDETEAYCCYADIRSIAGDTFVVCEDTACSIGPEGCNMIFPIRNDANQIMYKTALGGTTKSAWVKIAFQQYDGAKESPESTWETILTMGNESQPYNSELCKAVIKSFQYGWGTVDQGNRCRITILDQKGSSFQQWVERMGINPEGDSVPVQGKYRMKVQFGWYTTGGGEADVCGQPPMPLTNQQTEAGELKVTVPAEGFNSAYIICSPVMWFITDWINVHFENGKFIYELEGVDLLVRGQEQIIQQTFGRQGQQMYFTKAVELLGKISFPPFRPEFKALNSLGQIVDMQFVPRDGKADDRQCNSGADGPLCELGFNFDCQGWGPYDVWPTSARAPLAVIHEWLKKGVFAKDLTGKITSNLGRTSITMNYDPTYKFKSGSDPCSTCGPDQPQYGRLLLWANGIPYCQGNFNEPEINRRMKAVYIVNGGNCSPVLHFAPAFRWHSMAAAKAGGGMVPGIAAAAGAITGALGAPVVAIVNQIVGMVKTGCPTAASPGPVRNAVITPTTSILKVRNPAVQTQEATYHHVMTNLVIGAIEADLRVQGDPVSWLCTPLEGYGRCVGIVFINPYFLVHGETDEDCPIWAANDPDTDSPFKSICNELLTSKGWFIMGADHQIKDGNYITTLKLKLLAPGAEVNPAGSVIKLGAWTGAQPLPYGGQFGCLNKTLFGSAGAGWSQDEPNVWVGGGTPCGANYVDTGSEPLPPD